jgi:hypothetical protein
MFQAEDKTALADAITSANIVIYDITSNLEQVDEASWAVTCKCFTTISIFSISLTFLCLLQC